MMRLKYTDGSPTTDYLNAFHGIINQLADMGIKFEDEIQGLCLLESHRVLLHSQMSWSQKDGGEVKAEAPSNRGAHYEVLQTVRKDKKKKKYNNQKNKHKKDDDGDDNTKVNTTTDEFFVCYDYDMVNLPNDDWSWILDSGATCHVATRKDYYSSYTPCDFGVVKMGNIGLSRIASIGDICLKLYTGMELVLHNVKHVSDMKLNIISTGLLDEDGYHNSSDERSKLDVKTKPCVFLGYGQDEFGYRLYDPVHKKLVCSRDFGDDIHNDEEHGADDVDAQEQPNLDEDVHPELPPDMPPFLPLRQSTRDHHPSTHYFAYEYVLLTDGGEPECYAEAIEDEHKKEWFESMQDVFKLKTEEHTSRPRYKARLVVKGFSQKRGIDFDEIFSSVVKMGSIRVVLGLAASLDLEVEQMDVKTAFLLDDLDKEIYMEQHEGFQVKGKEDNVCRLQKILYGLKQAPRQWYKKFESIIGKQGYQKTSSDHCVFFQRVGDDDFFILLLYVDDMLIVGKNVRRIAQLKQD
nr:retrovirus-related Pol polyprotein from transposon TNT 1-94 [Tanacetum cinerariifolium]